MKEYNPQKIEKKWAKYWIDKKIFTPNLNKSKKPYYALFMFPYPSAEGLHIGNFYAFTCVDVMAKYKKLQGFDVFEPVGWDAFGIHSENYALKIGEAPGKMLKRTIKNFRQQLQAAGLSCDWTREINTTTPEYYKWTQWIFTKLFEKGLAYQKEAFLNWCPGCKTVLADEQIENGKCERCKALPEKRKMKQWFFKITEYADRLLDSLDSMDWSDITKNAQRNWIGRSEGARIKFKIDNTTPAFGHPSSTEEGKGEVLEVFTTRADTLFGCTYVVLSPEHELVLKITAPEQKKSVEKYIIEAGRKSELERKENKEKTGVFTGSYAINPANSEKIPIWVADYVLAGYGTGAIMAVPAHDDRDFEFAQKFKLPIKKVIISDNANCIIVHGCPSEKEKAMNPATRTYDKHWIPWLKKELEKQGIKTETPLMPAPWEPDYEAWKKEFEKNNVNENTILIGHSCGCSFLVRWLGETKRKINKLILVAPWKIREDASEEEKDFYEFSIDVSIKNRVKDIVMFTADNEAEDGKRGLKMFNEALGGKIINLQGHGHYVMKHMGTEKFPELLERILENEEVLVDYGRLVNSGAFDGLKSEEAIKEIAKWLEKNNLGEKEINYKLRDWCISRQRYWGPPIPIIYCEKCGAIPVPEKDLPVLLPDLKKNWEPAGDGKGPLAKVEKFMKTKCPECSGPAQREPDVMDNFLDSAWYFFRYISPFDKKEIFNKELSRKWLPIDIYIGGNEHAVLHLMYTRFITMVLHDLRLVDFDNPFKKFRANGMILKDGKKMSKSKGNVVNPEEYGERIGYDALKSYILFLGPLSEDRSFSDEGIMGLWHWANRLFNLKERVLPKHKDSEAVVKKLHKTIKAVAEDMENQKYNTAIAKLMELTNVFYSNDKISKNSWEKFLIIVSIFMPALAEELWAQAGHKKSIFLEKWPEYDSRLIIEDSFELVVQINGKVRDKINVAMDIAQKEAEKIILASDKVKKWIEGKEIKKVVFVKNRLINIII